MISKVGSPTICFSALGATSDSRSLILAGNWCESPESIQIFKLLGTEIKVAAPRLVSSTVFQLEAESCEKLFDFFIDELQDCLNQYHGTSYSKRYWTTVLHSYLYPIIATTIDHYEVIRELAAKYGKVEAEILNTKLDWCDAHDVSSGSSRIYHFLVFSRLVELTDFFTPVVLPDDYVKTSLAKVGDGKKKAKKVKRAPIKIFLASLVSEFKDRLSGRATLESFREKPARYAFLGDQYLTKKDLGELFKLLGEKAVYLYGRPLSKEGFVDRDFAKRASIFKENADSSEIEKVIRELIKLTLPTIYLENFSKVRDHIESIIPNRKVVLLNSVNCSGGVCVDFFMASSVEKFNSTHVMACHGGCFGIMETSVQERVWAKFVDKYALWSNTTSYGGISKVLKMPSLRFHKWSSWEKDYDKKGKALLFITGYYPSRYAYNSIYPYTLDPEYERLLIRFLEALDGRNREELCIRDYHNSQSLNESPFKRWVRENKILVDASLPFEGAVKEASVCVHSIIQTTYLETITMGRPTICFWNPEVNLIRKDLEVYFERMFDVGIFHHDPESAARKLMSIKENPMKWWKSKDVTIAVSEFQKNVACISPSGMSEWASLLKSI